MPVGPYPTFDACVVAQKRQGKSDESARAICGMLEQESKKREQLREHRRKRKKDKTHG